MSAYIAFETTRCELLTIIESATVEQSRNGVDKKSPTLRWPALAVWLDVSLLSRLRTLSFQLDGY